MSKPASRIVSQLFLLSCLALVLPSPLLAEQLPLKVFTTTEGLPNNSIECIVRDSEGFLWVCTADGLSRFDGYTFKNYGVDQGLPDRSVTYVLESRNGNYWVGTDGGLARFKPASRNAENGRVFSIVRPSSPSPSPLVVSSLTEDRVGTVWCGTPQGLYRLVKASGEWSLVFVDLDPGKPAPIVNALVEDPEGALWIAAEGKGLIRRWPDGRIEHYNQREGLPAGNVKGLYCDHEGRIWLAMTTGLCQLTAHPRPLQRVAYRFYNTRDGLPADWVHDVFETSDGKLWVATAAGVVGSPTKNTGRLVFTAYTMANGLSDGDVGELAEDREGNLWIGSGYGLMKLARGGFHTYTSADGLRADLITSVFEDRAGQICVVNHLFPPVINCLEGTRFTAVAPRLPKAVTATGWGWGQVGLQDHTGEWWLATGRGLLRYPRVAHLADLARTLPKALYTTRDGLQGNSVFRLFEDSRGDIWVGTETWGGRAAGVTRWERSTGRFHRYGPQEGLAQPNTPAAFVEDRAGNIWVGFMYHDVARCRNGRFTVFSTNDGLPYGSIQALYLDREGRLWAGTTRGGVARIDDPTADHPTFVTYSSANGLFSNMVKEITGDSWGRIYIMTGRSLDCLDPKTGHIKHYSTADGLGAVGSDSSAVCDRHGRLWFGTRKGLSWLAPQPPSPALPPPIRINALWIRGLPHPVTIREKEGNDQLELEPGQNRIQVEFASLNFGVGEVLRFQYRLEGAEREWSPPTDQRSVSYARLAPGEYRFQVRAVNSDGVASPVPAFVRFRLLPPIWQRGWFLALAALVLGLLAYALHHLRVERLLELERVRARIALDLHDDIGSGLSEVAILSEVVRQTAGSDSPRVSETVARIASISRELLDSMGDIVWAINPRKDSFRGLEQRMRRFASDTLTARNIDLDFRACDSFADTALRADVRREVFLIFKEGINNALRHSECNHVTVELGIEKHQLSLSIGDDGRGFDPTRMHDGHGLSNMASRARALDGSLELESKPGKGTLVKLWVPLSGIHHRMHWRQIGNRTAIRGFRKHMA